MKKIDKSKCLAFEYFSWQKKTKANYYSSHKYYKDVLISLLNNQNGICAYTEYRLIDQKELGLLMKKFDSKNKYIGNRPECPADNEHFDSKLKEKYGWSWDNFFAVYSPINRDIKRVREAELIKEGKKMDDLMKPDHSKYNPNILLEYDVNENIFVPNRNLDSIKFEIVKSAIYVLGLNYSYIKMKRKEYLSEKINQFKSGSKVDIEQFHTAYEMSIASLK